ncbi:hypothetical protein [Leptotrichia sp. OH3620_COT-345]|nr:hypothetical protein [Leptotrichia sp. OH3620_COT-345]
MNLKDLNTFRNKIKNILNLLFEKNKKWGIIKLEKIIEIKFKVEKR